MPIFYSERVAFSIDGKIRYPFFLSKQDLDEAFAKLPVEETKRPDGAKEIPIGLVRVATLDGVVEQMRSGVVDLSEAILVPDSQAVALSKQL